ncbi:MAG TPA: exodeoxyribonuclease V subunit gamma, partial [Marmoricola sp.]|nr:exodeoxyribonuclease V subunit gamma [Marmoricola sp.]
LVNWIDGPSPLVRQQEILASLRERPEAFALPSRLSLFGHTRIPAAELELIVALSEHREVHLWLPHASPALWTALEGRAAPQRRSEDHSHEVVVQPVLRSLGRDLRELQASLGPVESSSAPVPEFNSGLLGRLQADIVANQSSSPQDPIPGDNSISVHACHGAARQVEVLREVILGLLADDHTLQPRDILVMCPDIESYVPLLTAAFGMGSVGIDEGVADQVHPGHFLRVMLADRSPVQTNELLGVLSRVLEIAGGRAEASRVLDLMAVPAVRRRFGWSDEDLEQITEWVAEAGVRWAFDARHRASYGLDGVLQDTWSWGVDRILAGVAVSADAGVWFGTTLPLDQVSSGSIDLAGRLAEFIDRLGHACTQLNGTHPISHWLDTLVDTAEALSLVDRGEEWQVGQLRREVAALDLNGARGDQVHLRLADVRELLAERLQGRPSRANFRSGTLTVCTMTPMRSVPHRVVCLLGLDDGRFPRSASTDGDDALLRDPLVGERDARSEDRQLLLDAVLSATDHLVITYTGANETNNQTRPPSVPLQELIDCLSRMSNDKPEFVFHHPLQPFAVANFTSQLTSGDQAALSFDHRAFAAAVAARAPRNEPLSISTITLTKPDPEEIDLLDLIAFFKSPAKQFVRNGLDIGLPQDSEGVSDQIPISVDGLMEWKIGEQVLEQLLNGMSPDHACQQAWRTGVLPPGRLGWARMTGIANGAQLVAAEVARLRAGESAQAIDVDLNLPNGTRITGTVQSLFGSARVLGTYSRLKQKNWLDAWIPHLVTSLHTPEAGINSGIVGRGPKPRRDNGAAESFSRAMFNFLADPDQVTQWLIDLVELYQLGQRQPLLLPMATAQNWVAHTNQSRAFAEARKAWLGNNYVPGEQAAAENALVWGPQLPFEEIFRINPGFDRQANQLWRPLLDSLAR